MSLGYIEAAVAVEVIVVVEDDVEGEVGGCVVLVATVTTSGFLGSSILPYISFLM